MSVVGTSVVPVRPWRALLLGTALASTFLFLISLIVPLISLRGLDDGEQQIQMIFVYAFIAVSIPVSIFGATITFVPAFFIFRHLRLSGVLYYIGWGTVVFGLTAFLTAALKPTGATLTTEQMQWFIIAPAMLGGLAGLFFWLGAVRKRALPPIS